MQLKNRIAIVTGGGSGLSSGIAKRFAQEGATVVVADIGGKNAKIVAEEISNAKAKAIAIQLDVTDF